MEEDEGDTGCCIFVDSFPMDVLLKIESVEKQLAHIVSQEFQTVYPLDFANTY